MKSLRQAFFALLRVLCIVIITIILFELCLRLVMPVLPVTFKNFVLSKYNTRSYGIFFEDPEWHFQIMKPDFSQQMFYNGYYWNHKTNKIGIRASKDISQADIVVLGDSMLYGHGVNIEDTFCTNLERLSGLDVANLAATADYPSKEYLRLKRLGLFLKPRIVLFFINRSQDEYDFLSERPSRVYIDRIIEINPPGYKSNDFSYENYFKYYKNSPFPDMLSGLHTYRLCSSLKDYLRKKFLDSKRVENAQDLAAYKSEIKEFVLKIIISADKLCRSNNAQLVVILNALPFNYGEQDESFNAFCKKAVLDNNIAFFDLRTASPRRNYFLEGDGHYSVSGNEWAAQTIYKYLKSKRML